MLFNKFIPLPVGTYDQESIQQIKDIKVFLQDAACIECNRRMDAGGVEVRCDYDKYLLEQFAKIYNLPEDDQKLSKKILRDLDQLANTIIPELKSLPEYQVIAEKYEKCVKEHDNIELDFFNDYDDAFKAQAEAKFEIDMQEVQKSLADLIAEKKYQCSELTEILPELVLENLKSPIDFLNTRQNFEEIFNNVIEKPCRELVKYLMNEGHRTFFSNAFSDSPKGVWWYDKDDHKPYFTSLLTQKTYLCGDDTGTQSWADCNVQWDKVHVVTPMDFSHCWPKITDFNQPDFPTNEPSQSKKFELVISDKRNIEPDNTPKLK